MSLNPNYVLSPCLQDFFIDKASGLPMTAGEVTFYSDINRTSLKSIYTISGNAPNYSFVELPNPITLSGVGTYQDNNGNDIVVYLYPFDEEGELELYYVTVTNADNVDQFTREAWPPFMLENDELPDSQLTNYIPNGQFLSHLNVPPTSTTSAGTIPSGQNVTVLGDGGWTFEKPSGFTSVDSISFSRFDSYTDSPSGSPRYAVNVVCSTPNSSESYKFLCVKFNDVNKFASEDQVYTFSFTAQVTGGQITPEITVIKYFGTGGTVSATVREPISPVTFTGQTQIFNTTITFGTNETYSIGTNNDDYVQVAINFPTSVSFNATLTDFMLLQGDVEVTQFEQQTNADMLTRSIGGWIDVPDADGNDLYLPIIKTAQGLTYDDSNIGNIALSSYPTARNNQLLCNGAIVDSTAYSSLGIPYTRLLNVLYNASGLVPIFGTGSTYATQYIYSANVARLSTNQSGAQTVASNGVLSAGLTYSVVAAGRTTAGVLAAVTDQFTAYLYGTEIGLVTAATAGNSGFTVDQLLNNAGLKQQVSLLATYGGSLGSKYFTFSALLSAVLTNFYVWFDLTGSDADPAPGGTGIKVRVPFAVTNIELTYLIIEAINGYCVQYLTYPAGNTITAGSYFSFYTNTTQQNVVYYIVDDDGDAPSLSNVVFIPVSISSTNTSTQVCSLTTAAINRRFYALPDLRNDFIRIWGNGLAGVTARTNNYIENAVLGGYIGSFQNYNIQSHTHSGSVGIAERFGSTGSSSQTAQYTGLPSQGTFTYTLAINTTGGNETLPQNVALNAVIYY